MWFVCGNVVLHVSHCTRMTTSLMPARKSTKLQMGFTRSARLLNHNLPSQSLLIHVVCTVALRCKTQQHRCDCNRYVGLCIRQLPLLHSYLKAGMKQLFFLTVLYKTYEGWKRGLCAAVKPAAEVVTEMISVKWGRGQDQTVCFADVLCVWPTTGGFKRQRAEVSS